MRVLFAGGHWILLFVVSARLFAGGAPAVQAQRALNAILQGFYWTVHPGDITKTDGVVWGAV